MSAVASGTRIFAITPSSMASYSIVALSVSISARMSPALTLSPSFLSHLARFPFSMVGDSAGMRMLIGIGRPSRFGARAFAARCWFAFGRLLDARPRRTLLGGFGSASRGAQGCLQRLSNGSAHLGLGDLGCGRVEGGEPAHYVGQEIAPVGGLGKSAPRRDEQLLIDDTGA